MRWVFETLRSKITKVGSFWYRYQLFDTNNISILARNIGFDTYRARDCLLDDLRQELERSTVAAYPFSARLSTSLNGRHKINHGGWRYNTEIENCYRKTARHIGKHRTHVGSIWKASVGAYLWLVAKSAMIFLDNTWCVLWSRMDRPHTGESTAQGLTRQLHKLPFKRPQTRKANRLTVTIINRDDGDHGT